jgi:hypothetical protein
MTVLNRLFTTPGKTALVVEDTAVVDHVVMDSVVAEAAVVTVASTEDAGVEAVAVVKTAADEDVADTVDRVAKLESPKRPRALGELCTV